MTSFGETIRPLLLAPLAGIGAFVGWELLRLNPGALIIGLYVAPFCYAAELVFVVPVLWWWPASRRPSFSVAATWGVIVAWLSAAILYGRMLTPVGVVGFCFAGAVSGVLYAWLIDDRPRSTSST